MTMNFSDTVRNAGLDAIETAIGASAVLKLFGGAAKPANTGTADAGTVIATMNLPADWMAAASGGSKAKAGTWQDLTADNAGLARYWRLYASNGTTCHGQGPAGQSWAAGVAYSVGQHVIANSNVYVCTTGGTSGGTAPTGTGTGISDGVCVWNYVEPASGVLLLNNGNIAQGQEVTVQSWTWTAGNA